jgi:type I restriction enzyme, R subunit
VREIVTRHLPHLTSPRPSDWTMHETARARLRVFVKRILSKYRQPPDKQQKATQTVLEQAALLAAGWPVP